MGDQLPARPGHLDVEPGPATRGHLDVEPTGPRKSGYVADTRRWVVLALFGANTFLWAGSWIVFAPVADLAEQRFQVGPAGINAFGTSFLWTYLPSSLLSLYVTDTYGVHTCLSASATINALALLVRWAALASPLLSPHQAFAINLGVQIAGSSGQAMALNLAARVTMDWFPTEERDLATTAATMFSVFGQMFFSLVTPMLVHTPEQLGVILLVQWPPAIAVAVASWLLLVERPPSPPSASAALQWKEAAAAQASAKHRDAPALVALEEMWHDVRALFENVNFLCLAAGFAVGTGTVWALLILVEQFINPCGYSDSLAGVAGASLLGAGIVAAFGVGAAMEYTKAYVTLQRAIMVAALVSTGALLLLIQPGHAMRLIGAFCLVGCALQPLYPLSLEHAAEQTFPIPADASTAVMLVGANTFSFILVLVLTPLLASPSYKACTTPITPAACVTITCMAAGLMFTLLVRPQYVRSKAEMKRRQGSSGIGAMLGEDWGVDSPNAATGQQAPLLGKGDDAAGGYGAAAPP